MSKSTPSVLVSKFAITVSIVLIGLTTLSPDAFAQIISTDRSNYEAGDTVKVTIQNTAVVGPDDLITVCQDASGSAVCHDLWRTVNGSKLPDGTVSDTVELSLPYSLLPAKYKVNLQDSAGQIIGTTYFTIQSNAIHMDKVTYTVAENVTAQYNVPMDKDDQFQFCTPAELAMLDSDCSKAVSVDEFAASVDYTPSRTGTFAVPANSIGIGDYAIVYKKGQDVLAASGAFSITEGGSGGTQITLEAVSAATTKECQNTWYEAPICASLAKDSVTTVCECGSNSLKRGIHVQVVTKQGQVLPARHFDLLYDSADLPKLQTLIDYLSTIEEGDALLFAVADASFQGWMTTRPRMTSFYNVMEGKFSAAHIREMVFRRSYAGVFVAGSAPLAEVIGGNQERIVASAEYRLE